MLKKMFKSVLACFVALLSVSLLAVAALNVAAGVQDHRWRSFADVLSHPLPVLDGWGPVVLMIFGIGVVFALGVAIVVFLPVQFLLSRRGWVTARHFAVLGLAASLAVFLLGAALNPKWLSADAESRRSLPVLLTAIFVMGEAATMIFWLVRRPDRDAVSPGR